MPVTLDPNATYQIILTSDQDKDPPPTFIYKYLNGAQWKKLAAVSDELETMITGADAIDAVYRIITVGLVGWENMIGLAGEPLEFDPEDPDLDEILTPAEAVEIMQAIMAQTPSLDDKKKLGSPSPIDSDRSANPVPDPESAATDPASASPSASPA